MNIYILRVTGNAKTFPQLRASIIILGTWCLNLNDQGVYIRCTNVFTSDNKNQNHLKLIEVGLSMLNMYIQTLIC